MPLEPISSRPITDPDRARVQAEAIASAQNNPEAHFAAYEADSRSFGGRYIAADLFKETFPAYAASPAARNQYNTVVHNAAAVLSSEQFRRVLARPDPVALDTVILLTGVPGAGKTSSVLSAGELSSDIKLVFEGQLVRPETTFPKVQQILDAGFKPLIIAAHAQPEDALQNTLRRYYDEGRGASIGTMADIQGGLPAGLRAVHEQFSHKVELRIYDYRDRSNPQALAGWDNLPILESEGNRDQVAERLRAELERIRDSGRLTDAAYRQATGQAPLPSLGRLDRHHHGEHAQDVPGRGLPHHDRAQDFLNLPRDAAIARHPELVEVFSVFDKLTLRLSREVFSEEQRSVVMSQLRTASAEKIAQGLVPALPAELQQVRDRDARERSRSGPER